MLEILFSFFHHVSKVPVHFQPVESDWADANSQTCEKEVANAWDEAFGSIGKYQVWKEEIYQCEIWKQKEDEQNQNERLVQEIRMTSFQGDKEEPVQPDTCRNKSTNP